MKRKRTNIEDTDVKIPIETWMQSQDASGFPKIIGKILDQLDLDSLINCRQVSMTFKSTYLLCQYCCVLGVDSLTWSVFNLVPKS